MITERIGSYFLFIQGFRGARLIDSERVLRDLRGSFRAVDLQLLRADRVAGKEHIIFAAKNAVGSFGGKGRRAKHLSMELLLYASGEHQIVEAIKLLGVTASSTELVFVGLSETNLDPNVLISRVAKAVNGLQDDTVLDFDALPKPEGLKRAYHISDFELNSARMPGEAEDSVLKRLVIERSALLVLEN
jgi:tRNA threonylcarbamoyladenosine modification (KEOPS) complex Cgi121 subunit